ncbi:hypothetical protein [Sphingobacterium tabacisoli]|uniref:Uncharacterized protein n=1 Tax=Sphingobacterium tabacisoli TaxID=2044855 RepID=A0ABW5L4H7_9SPHI|nr:hypothetical protein [Sphingobacterium tabacisoli]
MVKPYGLKVTFNGDTVSKAGIEKENYVVTACVSFVHRNDGGEFYNFNVGGMDSDLRDHLNWYRTNVGQGDSITMEVIQGPFDEPTERFKVEQSEEEKLKIKLEEYHYLKNKLKDHI